MGADHPIAWKHPYDGGRAWYTAGGHTSESYGDPLFITHLLGGILYAAGGTAATAAPPKLDSVTVKAVSGRIAVSVRVASCSHCTGEIRVGSLSSIRPIRFHGADGAGSWRGLPHGRWRVTIVITDGVTGRSVTASRTVRLV